jgi:hypothetical protein
MKDRNGLLPHFYISIHIITLLHQAAGIILNGGYDAIGLLPALSCPLMVHQPIGYHLQQRLQCSLNQCWPFLPLTSFIPLGHGDSEVRSY